MLGPAAKEFLDVILLIGALLGAAAGGYKAKGIRRNGNGKPIDTFKIPARPELMSVEAQRELKVVEDKAAQERGQLWDKMMPKELCSVLHGALSDKVVGLGVVIGTLRTDLKEDLQKVDKQIEHTVTAMDGVKKEMQTLVLAVNNTNISKGKSPH